MDCEKVLLIQSDYGYEGFWNGSWCSMHYRGLNLWRLIYDRTIEGLEIALTNAQSSSPQVKAFEAEARKMGMDLSYGRWFLFSVIESD